nr:MAG TPA: hypothetical protein [Caudoviricetes sp.]
MAEQDLFFKRDALSNNTFDFETEIKAIEECKLSSFQYLYQLQKEMTRYKRFDFHMMDLQRSDRVNHKLSLAPRKWVLYVPGDFLDDDDRLRYRRSKFYDKQISQDDTLNNKDVFTNSYMVFVNGELCMDGVNIYCKEDRTYLVFNIREKPSEKNGLVRANFKYMREINAPITVLFMPNYSNFLLQTTANAVDHFNTVNGGLSLTGYNITDNTLCYCLLNDTHYGEELKLTKKNGKIIIDPAYIKYVKKNYKDNNILLKFFDLEFFHKKIELGNDQDDVWFQLELEDYPISIDNMLIFDNNGIFMHDLKIDMYYPNIYKIVGDIPNDRTLKVYVFYKKNSKTLKHKNALAMYYKYMTNILGRYKNNTIQEIIKNYVPKEIIYSIDDYKGSVYFDDSFKYKTKKMKQLTREDGEWFRIYLKYLAIQNRQYYLDMSKIELDQRVKNDNSDIKLDTVEEFDEPMYLFVLSNRFRNKFDDLIVLVDGTKRDYDCKIYGNDDYVFLYIPVRFVSYTSIIEIEKLPEFITTYDFRGDPVTRRASIDLKYPNDEFHHPLINDVYLVDMDNDKLVPMEAYELYSRVGDDVYNLLDHNSYLQCPEHFEIRLKHIEYIGRNLQLRISKRHSITRRTVYTINDIFTSLKLTDDCKKDTGYFRVYKNGRCIPRHVPIIQFTQDPELGPTAIISGVGVSSGQELVAEMMPYKMKQVYYKKRIEQYKMVELDGYIDKPFDLRWHDVYINGRKLNRDNIEIISSNKIIIKNVRSTRNFEIVENSRDDEYFGYLTVEDIIDRILGVDEEFKKNIEKTIAKIIDDEDDILEGGISIIDYLLYSFYYDYLVPNYGLLNPNEKQLDVETQKKYHQIMDGEPFLFNPDYGRLNAMILPINPDDDSLG